MDHFTCIFIQIFNKCIIITITNSFLVGNIWKFVPSGEKRHVPFQTEVNMTGLLWQVNRLCSSWTLQLFHTILLKWASFDLKDSYSLFQWSKITLQYCTEIKLRVWSIRFFSDLEMILWHLQQSTVCMNVISTCALLFDQTSITIYSAQLYTVQYIVLLLLVYSILITE